MGAGRPRRYYWNLIAACAFLASDMSHHQSISCACDCKPLHSPFASIDAWRPRGFGQEGGRIPLIRAEDVRPLVAGLDLWDSWPLAHPDGRTAVVGGRQYWFFLSAPQFADPMQRHGHARIRLGAMDGAITAMPCPMGSIPARGNGPARPCWTMMAYA